MGDTNRNMTVSFHLFALVLLSFFPLFNRSVFADDVEIFYFYEAGCASCERLEEFFEQQIKPNYPVVISRFEIHVPDNATLMLNLADAYDAKEILEEGTPAIFIGDKAFQGDSPETLKGIEEAIRILVSSEAPSAPDSLQQESQCESH